ncbi:hypothetical protein SAMN02745702_02969 [Desulfobaculum bizertense DSM 18034]|uniref:Uncharacterized protein n=2 Tax=Desulfobaculum TaxID=1433996 RepID=A0A1T4X4G9_9BACT|nr:hypothetical protein SAMN02745702_02969 [Desulfobaculum bizertense DSM 18034]
MRSVNIYKSCYSVRSTNLDDSLLEFPKFALMGSNWIIVQPLTRVARSIGSHSSKIYESV